jgi:hypothetical protein
MKFTEFARVELGLTLTNGQRVLSLVAFDGLEPRDLDPADREIARVFFGDVDEVPPLARRILVLLLGRLSGKTLLSAAFALFVLVTADVSGCGPGDLPSAIVIAPSKKLARLAVRAGWELAQRSVRLRKRVEKTPDGFVLTRRDGRVVAFESYAAAKGGASARGNTILVAILDEAEFFMSDESGSATFAVNDRDVYRAIAPRARLTVFLSTPWPVPCLMSELIEQNWESPTVALAAKAPTLVMRDNDPAIAIVVEAERLRDAANAAREFDADDSAGSGSSLFYDPIALAASIDKSRPLSVIAPPGALRAAGVDLSATRDPSTCAVLGSVDGEIGLLDLIELRPKPGAPLKMSESIATFAATIKQHGLASFIADGWGREAAREYATAAGLRIDSAPDGRGGKAIAFLAHQKQVNEGRFTLPNHPRLIAQLKSVTSRPGPGGALVISSPRRAGSHGDLVSALVLAAWSLADRPVARFRAPVPIWMPPSGGGASFDGIGPPSVYVAPDFSRPPPPPTGADFEEDALRTAATANASPSDNARQQPGFSLVGFGPHDPFDGF